MNKEVETELKAKLKQLPMPEKIKCSALYKHLLEVYAAQSELDLKNRKVIFDFTTETQPLVKQMADIAMGNVDLTDELLEGKENFFTAEELEAGEHRNKDKLDGYYLTVLKKSPELVKQITPADEPILKHITYVEPIVYADKDDYAVKFHFSANEWFTNSTLEVTVVTDTEGNATEIKSDVITWAEGKDVTSKTVTKKQKNKRTGQARTTTKTEKIDSFFRIFESLEDPGSDAEEEDEDDEGADMDLHEKFQEMEGLIGVIKDNVPSYAGPAFFGVKIPELEYEEMFGDDDYEDEDEDAEDDEEEEEDAPKKGKKGGMKGKASGDAKNQECKQN